MAILTMCGRWPAASTASMNRISSSACSWMAGLSRNIWSNDCSTPAGGGSSKLATSGLTAPGRSAPLAGTRTIAVTSAPVSASASSSG